MKIDLKSMLMAMLLLLGLKAHASDFSYDQDGIPCACVLIKQGGAADDDFCRNSISKIRCFAHVEYTNGRRQRYWGKQCVPSEEFCERTENSAVRPACLDVEDID